MLYIVYFEDGQVKVFDYEVTMQTEFRSLVPGIPIAKQIKIIKCEILEGK